MPCHTPLLTVTAFTAFTPTPTLSTPTHCTPKHHTPFIFQITQSLHFSNRYPLAPSSTVNRCVENTISSYSSRPAARAFLCQGPWPPFCASSRECQKPGSETCRVSCEIVSCLPTTLSPRRKRGVYKRLRGYGMGVKRWKGRRKGGVERKGRMRVRGRIKGSITYKSPNSCPRHSSSQTNTSVTLHSHTLQHGSRHRV